jgi:hypothetical protein
MFSYSHTNSNCGTCAIVCKELSHAQMVTERLSVCAYTCVRVCVCVCVSAYPLPVLCAGLGMAAPAPASLTVIISAGAALALRLPSLFQAAAASPKLTPGLQFLIFLLGGLWVDWGRGL